VWTSRDYVTYLLDAALSSEGPAVSDIVHEMAVEGLAAFPSPRWKAPSPVEMMASPTDAADVRSWILQTPLSEELRNDEYHTATMASYFTARVQGHIDQTRHPKLHVALGELLALLREYAAERCTVLKGAVPSPFAPLYLSV